MHAVTEHTSPESSGGTLIRRRDQSGVALIMALVILLILTILGVAAMGTSSLEQKMAGNTQESTRAFEAAESGLNKALNTAGSQSLTGTTTNSFTFSDGTKADVDTNFVQFAPPKRGSGYSATSYDAANFDQKSTGVTNAFAKSIVHRGIGQIVNKTN